MQISTTSCVNHPSVDSVKYFSDLGKLVDKTEHKVITPVISPNSSVAYKPPGGCYSYNYKRTVIEIVYRYIQNNPGQNAHEINKALSLKSAGAHASQLVRSGYVVFEKRIVPGTSYPNMHFTATAKKLEERGSLYVSKKKPVQVSDAGISTQTLGGKNKTVATRVWEYLLKNPGSTKVQVEVGVGTKVSAAITRLRSSRSITCRITIGSECGVERHYSVASSEIKYDNLYKTKPVEVLPSHCDDKKTSTPVVQPEAYLVEPSETSLPAQTDLLSLIDTLTVAQARGLYLKLKKMFEG